MRVTLCGVAMAGRMQRKCGRKRNDAHMTEPKTGENHKGEPWWPDQGCQPRLRCKFGFGGRNKWKGTVNNG